MTAGSMCKYNTKNKKNANHIGKFYYLPLRFMDSFFYSIKIKEKIFISNVTISKIIFHRSYNTRLHLQQNCNTVTVEILVKVLKFSSGIYLL